MKNSTKNAAIGIAAIMLIAVFAVISCTGEAELTTPDWSEYEKQFSSNKIGPSSDYLDASNILVNGNFEYNTPVQTVSDKEVTVAFPNQSDFLRNPVTTSALTAFMTFNTYTTGTPATDDVSYPTSVLSSISYEFTRLERYSSSYTLVYIKLGTVPNTDTIVMKIDSEKFTYANGKKLGSGDWKGETGVTPYDDGYYQINVDYGAYNDLFNAPGGSDQGLTSFEVFFGNPSGLTTEKTAWVGVYYHSGAIKKQGDLNSAMTELRGKLTLEQYDSEAGVWKDSSGTFNIRQTGTPPVNSQFIDLIFTPRDAVSYRIKAEGVQYLELGPYDGVTHRVNVVGYDNDKYDDAYPYQYETVYSDVYTYKEASTSTYTNPTSIFNVPNSFVETDAKGKNVVLHYIVNQIMVTPQGGVPGPVYLPSSAPSLETFNKNVKFIYNRTNTNIIALNSNTTFGTVKITKVEYKRSDYNAPGDNYVNEMVITLDPEYTYNGSGRKSLILAPGFHFGDSAIKFGNYSNEFPIDGVHYFGIYDTGLVF